MTGLWIALVFLIWYVLALVISERYSGNTRIGKQWLFFISFIFSPFAGFILVFLLRSKQ